MQAANCYTIFDSVTRRPVQRVTCCEDQLHAHVKPGQTAIVGRFDWSSVLDDAGAPRTDTGRVSDADREKRRAARLLRIAELENKQHRRVRELLEASDPRLQEISREIEQLRTDLK